MTDNCNDIDFTINTCNDLIEFEYNEELETNFFHAEIRKLREKTATWGHFPDLRHSGGS